jgi:hypothetical protein
VVDSIFVMLESATQEERDLFKEMEVEDILHE